MKILQPEIVPLILVKNDEYWLPYVLQSARGWFDRYVIYDVGSTDRTPEIINWFKDTEDKADVFVRYMPHVNPIVQGAFRNSMIAEARSEWYLILDGDELYTQDGFQRMTLELEMLKRKYESGGVIYGIVPRVEVLNGLDRAYGQDLRVPHHRLYHRTAVFCGTHPGEWPLYTQKSEREFWLDDACACYHFHNTERSHDEVGVPKRVERKSKKTYHPGHQEDFDLFSVLPILRKRIEDFPINPALKQLQDGDSKV